MFHSVIYAGHREVGYEPAERAFRRFGSQSTAVAVNALFRRY